MERKKEKELGREMHLKKKWEKERKKKREKPKRTLKGVNRFL